MRGCSTKTPPQNLYVGEKMNLEKLQEKRISVEHKIAVKTDTIKKKQQSVSRGKTYLSEKYGIDNLGNINISDYRDWYAYPDIASVYYTIRGNLETIAKLEESIKEYEEDLKNIDRNVQNITSVEKSETKLPDVLLQLKEFLCNCDNFCVDNEDEVMYTIIDFYFKVEDAVGGNSDWSNTCCIDASVSGVVKGNNGNVSVSSVIAGGHDVQKSHLRTVIRKTQEDITYEEEGVAL